MLQISDKKFPRYLLVVTIPSILFVSIGYTNLLSAFKKQYQNLAYISLLTLISLWGFYTYFSWKPQNILGYNNEFYSYLIGDKITPDWG